MGMGALEFGEDEGRDEALHLTTHALRIQEEGGQGTDEVEGTIPLLSRSPTSLTQEAIGKGKERHEDVLSALLDHGHDQVDTGSGRRVKVIKGIKAGADELVSIIRPELCIGFGPTETGEDETLDEPLGLRLKGLPGPLGLEAVLQEIAKKAHNPIREHNPTLGSGVALGQVYLEDGKDHVGHVGPGELGHLSTTSVSVQFAVAPTRHELVLDVEGPLLHLPVPGIVELIPGKGLDGRRDRRLDDSQAQLTPGKEGLTAEKPVTETELDGGKVALEDGL
jgi:hypothetical protein